MKKVWRIIVICLAAFLSTPAAVFAEDPLGTAGRFRFFGWANCGKPIAEQLKGGCDPAPVDTSNLSPSEIAHAHIQRAIKLVSFLRMHEARAAADEALRADPKNVEALTFRARLAMSNLDGESAERDLNAGLLLAPNDPSLLASRAERLLELGKTELALRDASMAVSAAPPSPDTLWIRARILMQQNRLEEAESDLDQALQLEPAGLRVRLFRAHVRLRLGRFEEAISDTDALLAQRPSDPSAIEVRAFASAALGRTADAVRDLTAILGNPGEPGHMVHPSSPYYSRLRALRAMLLVQLGRGVDAEHDLDLILTRGGKQAVLRMQLHLRRNGFPDVPLDGQRTHEFDEALKACFLKQACGRGLTRSL
jgi:tetratricopeptide (TPR) repeat protein